MRNKTDRRPDPSASDGTEPRFDRELRILLVLGAGAVILYILMAVGLFGLLGFESAQSLDVRFGYTGQTAGQVLTDLGDRGRIEYLVFHCLDYLFALALYPSLGILIRRQIRESRLPTPVSFLALLPLAAGLCDIIENLIIDLSLLGFPRISLAWLGAAGGFTLAKFLLLGLGLLALVVLGLYRYTRRTGDR